MHAGMSGQFTLTRMTANGVIIEERTFKNLILDQGLNAIYSLTTTYDSYAFLSTATATPLASDTGMGGTGVYTVTASPVFASDYVNSGSPSYNVTRRSGLRFNAGVAIGTWSTIGIGWGIGANQLFAKTRIKDGLGNDSSITILAGEILDIRYELTCTFSTTPSAAAAITVNGVGMTYTVSSINRGAFNAMRVNQPLVSASSFSAGLAGGTGTLSHAAITTVGNSADIGAFTGTGLSPYRTSGAISKLSSIATWQGYTAGAFNADIIAVFPSDYYRNDGGSTFQGVEINGEGWFPYIGILFSTPITKTNADTFTLRVKFTWGRV